MTSTRTAPSKNSRPSIIPSPVVAAVSSLPTSGADDLDVIVDEELGPIATAFGGGALLIGLLLAFNVAQVHVLTSIPVLMMAFGAVALAPTVIVNRIPVSISYIGVASWSILSIAWTESPETAIYLAKRDTALLIALPLAASVLSRVQVEQVILWAIRATVAITVFYLVTKPETRIGIGTPGEPNLPGWHGGFVHKNTMGPVLVIGLAAVLLFDRRPSTRLLTTVVIGVLLVGSQSTTAQVGAGIVVLIIPWLTIAFRLSHRHVVAFGASTLLVTVAIGAAVVASLQAVVQVAGKDLTFTGRTKIWTATLHAISDRPWQGYGLGGLFSTPETQYTARVLREIGFLVPHAHNGTLDMIAQFGLIGATLFFVMLIALIRVAVRSNRDGGRFNVWVLTSVIALILISLSESVFMGSWLSICGVMMVTCLKIDNARLRRLAVSEHV